RHLARGLVVHPDLHHEVHQVHPLITSNPALRTTSAAISAPLLSSRGAAVISLYRDPRALPCGARLTESAT
ncbi:hypothetical protein, partial [Gordonibacter pamelaeae]|uniref:hypothetical protein n=1 Tax=Gordonibacter pamelaeae TaxID=471189 RepID=UPI003A8E66B5